jgi:hypothetical protein
VLVRPAHLFVKWVSRSVAILRSIAAIAWPTGSARWDAIAPTAPDAPPTGQRTVESATILLVPDDQDWRALAWQRPRRIRMVSVHVAMIA